MCVFGYRTLQVGQRPEAPCMSHCNCYTSSVSPVCGSNGVTYLSSCFAGCTRAISTGLQPPLSQVIRHLIYAIGCLFVCLFVSLCFFIWFGISLALSSCPAWVIRMKPTSHSRHTVCWKGHGVLPARHLNGYRNMDPCTHYHTEQMVSTGMDEAKTTVTSVVLIWTQGPNMNIPASFIDHGSYRRSWVHLFL